MAGDYVTVMAVFLQNKRDGKPLTITGDGSQTRDFTYVKDVARANMLAMISDKVGQGEVINIGGGHNYSIKEIAEKIGGEIKYIAPRVEPHDILADIAKAKELLGWQPQVSLDEELVNVVSWFEQENNIKF